MQNNPKIPNDSVYWLITIGLMFAFPPAGLVMALIKVLGNPKPKRGGRTSSATYHVYTPMGARTTGTANAQPTNVNGAWVEEDGLTRLTRRAKRLTRIGGAVTAIALFILLASVSDLVDSLVYVGPGFFFSELADLSPIICSAIAGGACLWSGWRKGGKLKRWRSYLAMIGRNSSISISSLATAANQSPQRVREELEDMLDEGVFPAGFLDYGGDRLILSSEGIQDSAPAPKREEKQESKQAEENAILEEIRAVNDAVANEKLSAQIDRIGVITAKILDYQKQHPEKSPQLHSFLSYYLPTTLKILRAYGQLEAQEVSGQNIDTAMTRIEGMMDKVVEGFEKQLDQLFQSASLDITTDVEVLERMLAKDGLSNGESMTLSI